MKKMTLLLLSIAMGLLLASYYSLSPRKMIMEYILSVYLSVSFINNDENYLIAMGE
jgi:hypothetical protein